MKTHTWMKRVAAATLFTFTLLASGAQASTTISTNISTGGTLAVTGASTLTGATTVTGALTASTGATVTAGGLTVTAGGITVTAGATSLGSTLGVTGLATFLAGATTTNLTLLNGEVISNTTDGVIQLGGIASTTSLTLLNGETITNAVDGTIALTGAATVSGAFTVTGATALNGGLTMDSTKFTVADTTGNTVTLGTLTVGADGAGTDFTLYTDTAGEELAWSAASNKLSLDGTNGTTAFEVTDGNVVISDDLTVSGTFSPAITSLSGTLTVTGNATSSASHYVAGAFTVGGNATTTPAGALALASTLNVGGLSTLAALTATGDTSLANATSTTLAVTSIASTTALRVSNNATVGGTFGVTGTSGFSNTLTISAGGLNVAAGNSSLSGGASTTNATVSGALWVGGNATTTAAGALTLNSSLAIGNGTAITKHLSGTASLDFGIIGANSCADLDITGITGAADGNTVSVGVPVALANASSTLTFTGFVKSGGDAVTVRACQHSTDATSDHAAATVRADVWQH